MAIKEDSRRTISKEDKARPLSYRLRHINYILQSRACSLDNVFFAYQVPNGLHGQLTVSEEAQSFRFGSPHGPPSATAAGFAVEGSALLHLRNCALSAPTPGTPFPRSSAPHFLLHCSLHRAPTSPGPSLPTFGAQRNLCSLKEKLVSRAQSVCEFHLVRPPASHCKGPLALPPTLLPPT
jgi:hypothetical protein